MLLKDKLICFLCCYIGFFACLYLIQININPVVASATTGLLASIIPNLKAQSYLYAASFLAIGAFSICKDTSAFILLPFVLFIVFLLTRRVFDGFGGKLGTVAFLATGIFLIIKRLI